MVLTLIIGKESNLSKKLSARITNSVTISARDLTSDIGILKRFLNEDVNIIFNNFQPAVRLNKLDNASEYIQNSVFCTASVLDFFKNSKVNKIIYTSSASVYGKSENHLVSPVNLHGALKVSNEMLVRKFCEERNIDYSIARVFNIFGGNDNFSIVHKLIQSIENGDVLTLVNNGSSIRDFIHVDDVAKVYDRLLHAKDIPVLDVGIGSGASVSSMIQYISDQYLVNTTNIKRPEAVCSVANSRLLKTIIDHKDFVDVRQYIKDKLEKEMTCKTNINKNNKESYRN